MRREVRYWGGRERERGTKGRREEEWLLEWLLNSSRRIDNSMQTPIFL